MALFPGTHLALFNSKFIGGVVSVCFGSKFGFLGDFMVVYFILELPICLFYSKLLSFLFVYKSTLLFFVWGNGVIVFSGGSLVSGRVLWF